MLLVDHPAVTVHPVTISQLNFPGKLRSFGGWNGRVLLPVPQEGNHKCAQCRSLIHFSFSPTNLPCGYRMYHTGVPHDHLRILCVNLTKGNRNGTGEDWSCGMKGCSRIALPTHLQSDAMVEFGNLLAIQGKTSARGEATHTQTNKQVQSMGFCTRAIRPRCGHSIRVFGVPPPVHAQKPKPWF